MAKRTWGMATLALAGLVGGCGDDGPSYGSLVAAVESPTGTVDATTTPAVVEKFDAAYGSGVSSTPFVMQSVSAPVPKQSVDLGAYLCDAGGNATANADGENGGTFSYDDCCISSGYYDEAGGLEACCISGAGSFYYGNEGSYTECSSFNLTTTCGGETVTSDFEGCTDASGNMVYSIEVEGESFAVSAEYNYYAGNGTLMITGANGSWTCTLTDYSGSCEGTGGSFEF